MHNIVLLCALMLASNVVVAQDLVTAQEWEAQARALAIEATGDQAISAPGSVEAIASEAGGAVADPATGAAHGWRYRYPYGAFGDQGERLVVTVTMEQGKEPVIEVPEHPIYPVGDADYLYELPANWIDSDAFLEQAKEEQLDEGWSINAMLESYEDAEIVSLRAYGGSMGPELGYVGLWYVEVRSAFCTAGISIAIWADGTYLSESSHPVESVGYCDPATDGYDLAKFLPFQPGNEWQYVRYGGDGIPIEHWHFEVVGDTSIRGEQYAVVTQAKYDTDLVLRESARCAVRLGGDTTARVVPVHEETISGTCGLALVGFPTPLGYELRRRSISVGEPFEVGGDSYHPEAMLINRIETSGINGYDYGSETRYASNVGLIEAKASENNALTSHTVLTFAHVGSTSLGVRASPVDDTTLPPTKEAIEGQPFPNPFTTTITVELHPAVPGPVGITVFDLLGRVVWKDRVVVPTGGMSQPIDMATVAAGLYLIRVEDVSGNVSYRKVLKR